MKKIANILLLLISVALFNNCSEELNTTEDLNYITFESLPIGIGVLKDGSIDYPVKVIVTQKSGSDRTFNVNVVADETTADEACYSVPTTVTIPANSYVGEITITVDDVNIGEDGETLALSLSGTDGMYVGNDIIIDITRVCPFNIDDFVGTYTYTSIMFGGSWAVEVQKVDDHTLVVKDMVEDGKDLQIVLDEATLAASVAKQEVYTHPSYGIASFEGDGSFSPCTLKIELDLELTVAAGSFGTKHEVLVKN